MENSWPKATAKPAAMSSGSSTTCRHWRTSLHAQIKMMRIHCELFSRYCTGSTGSHPYGLHRFVALQLPESTALMFSEWQLVLKTSNDFQCYPNQTSVRRSKLQFPSSKLDGLVNLGHGIAIMDPICGDILTSWYLQILPEQWSTRLAGPTTRGAAAWRRDVHQWHAALLATMATMTPVLCKNFE